MKEEEVTPEQIAELRALEKAATRRQIPGWPGYEADAVGRIWSVESNWRGYGARPLRQAPNSDGYPSVRLCRDGRRARRTVHSLVALAFHGERPSRSHEVRHLDGSRDNNVVTNLAWGTPLENAADRTRHGTVARGSRNGSVAHPERLARGDRSGMRMHPDRVARGARHPSAKLSEYDAARVKQLLKDGTMGRHICLLFGVSESLISKIKTGKSWRHISI